jgi:hypothetical protein
MSAGSYTCWQPLRNGYARLDSTSNACLVMVRQTASHWHFLCCVWHTSTQAANTGCQSVLDPYLTDCLVDSSLHPTPHRQVRLEEQSSLLDSCPYSTQAICCHRAQQACQSEFQTHHSDQGNHTLSPTAASSLISSGFHGQHNTTGSQWPQVAASTKSG